jgi:hypothetical protein
VKGCWAHCLSGRENCGGGIFYPQRDEVVLTPCNILGDDYLLLIIKYLIAHLAVIITMSGEKDSSGPNEFSLALSSMDMNSSAGKRKPVGASHAGQKAASTDTAAEDAPNLFVNALDTVSGRVLYPTSQSNGRLSCTFLS